MESFPQAKNENLFDQIFIGRNDWKKLYINWFEKWYGTESTWDFQWTYTKIINSSINIMPSKNLIKNIGHGHNDSTHTKIENSRYSQMELKELSFPLKHPKFVVIDKEFDDLNFKYNTHRNVIPSIYFFIDSNFPKWLTNRLKYLKNLLKVK